MRSLTFSLSLAKWVRANPKGNSLFCGQEKKFAVEALWLQEDIFSLQHHLHASSTIHNTDKMSAEGTSANGGTPGERHAIGISFGNSNSSIAYTTIEDKAEVIANEDGGMLSPRMRRGQIMAHMLRRSSNPFDFVICRRGRIQRPTS
jgi:hypothetical protein